jgi:hypothetical protein
MTRTDEYRADLRRLPAWEPYLLSHSGLPGPRGNLELAHAVAREGTEEQFRRWIAVTPADAPENTAEVFLVFCGALGLGAILGRAGAQAAGRALRDAELPPAQLLRALAPDPRWRVREGVATGLQYWGDADMPGLLAEMAGWAKGGYYEQRAAAAALCEPRLLGNNEHAAAVLDLLDMITQGIAAAPAADRRSEPFRTLRQALGYCWSVAVAALPVAGVPLMERWLAQPDLDVRWVMRENLKKKRLAPFLSAALQTKATE